MNRFKLLLLVATCALSFTACQKEQSLETSNAAPGGSNNGGNNGGNGGGTNNGSELGTWRFISARSIMNATMEGNVNGVTLKSVTSGDVTSINNSGNVVFDGKTMAFKDVAFSYDGKVTTEVYLNGQKFDTADEPFVQDYPASQETFDYKKVGSDSLYFANGITTGTGPNNVGQGPGGGKLKWEGDKMYLTIPAEISYTDNTSGSPMTVKTRSTITLTLQK